MVDKGSGCNHDDLLNEVFYEKTLGEERETEEEGERERLKITICR